MDAYPDAGARLSTSVPDLDWFRIHLVLWQAKGHIKKQ
jgi:hypothetical protein